MSLPLHQRRTTRLCVIDMLSCLIVTLASAQAGPATSDSAAAGAAFAAADWPTAATMYERISRAQPGNGMAWLRLGLARLNQGQAQQAKPALERALALKFNPMMAHMGLARVEAALGSRDRALMHLGESVTLGYSTPRLVERDSNLAAYKGLPVYDSLMARMHDTRFPCRKGAEHRQFDFWLGTWDVIIAGTKVGTNTITRAADGCAIIEDWNSPQQVGTSLNYYDSQTRIWHQIFVYDNGSYNHWSGGMIDGKMVFTMTAPNASGVTATNSRMTFARVSADSVTQIIETSTDGGKTWTMPWNSVYVRQK